MESNKLLSRSAVVADLGAASKKQVLAALADVLAAHTGAEAHDVLNVLLEREKLGTTGVGRGIAIPHGKLAGIDRIEGVFARLAEPVDFDAVDDEPVDLVFVLVAPENSGAEHLRALAKVSRMMRDRALVERLRNAADADALRAAIVAAEMGNAAA